MTYPTVGEKTIYRLFTISFLLLALVPTSTLNSLFGGGSPPSAPFDEPGPDPDNDQGNIFNMDELFQMIDPSLLAEGGVLAEE